MSQKVVCLVEAAHGLLQIDDVGLVPLSVDEWLHLRIPAGSLVPKVDASVDEFLNRD